MCVCVLVCVCVCMCVCVCVLVCVHVCALRRLPFDVDAGYNRLAMPRCFADALASSLLSPLLLLLMRCAGKRAGFMQRVKETSVKRWLCLEDCVATLYELTDLDCQHPIKSFLFDASWTASRFGTCWRCLLRVGVCLSCLCEAPSLPLPPPLSPLS